MEQNKPDQSDTATQNGEASAVQKRGNIVTKKGEKFVADFYTAPNSELPQKYESFPEETNVNQHDIKPCITDPVTGLNFEMPQRYYEAFTKESQNDVKPCVTNLPNGPGCELVHRYEAFRNETNVSHSDVESCVTINTNLNGPNSEFETYGAFSTETNKFQSDIKTCVRNLSGSHSEPSQIQRYVDFPYKKRYARQNDVTAKITDLDLLSNCESAPRHKTRHISVLPILIIENKVSKSVSHLTKCNQNTPVCYENDSDANKAKIKVTNSDILRPVSADLYQSNIDSFVSRDEDLENDKDSTIKPFSSWMQMVDHVEESQYKCDDCGKCFKRSCQLNQHLKMHTAHGGDDPTECVIEDPRRFTSKVSFDRHVSTDTGEGLFKCNECCKNFSTKTQFRRHIRTHTSERPFKCNECGKTFKRNSHLHDHIQTHTGEKPFKCNECDKCFYRNSGLHKHMKVHSEEKEFECKECYKSFRDKFRLQSHHLTIHKRDHQAFECRECHKRFIDSSRLKRHMRGHTGDKPCQCHECGKFFSQSYSLRVHMRTHTGEKPFQCNECGKCFSHKCSLQFHLRVHT